MALRYIDGVTDVQLGDRVTLRVLFRKRAGRVIYVPLDLLAVFKECRGDRNREPQALRLPKTIA